MHRGCTSAGTDARICSTVRARVRHVIDRREGAQSARQRRGPGYSEGGEGIEKKNNSPGRTVITTPPSPGSSVLMEIDKMYTIPMRRRSTNSDEERRRGLCHLCKQHGHIQWHCPTKNPDRAAATHAFPAPPKQTRPPQPPVMNQTTVLQYLKNTTQKIWDWIANALERMPPKDTATPGRLALTRVTKNEAANAFARALKTGTTRDAMRVPITLQTTQKKALGEAFLDCRATECFVSQ